MYLISSGSYFPYNKTSCRLICTTRNVFRVTETVGTCFNPYFAPYCTLIKMYNRNILSLMCISRIQASKYLTKSLFLVVKLLTPNVNYSGRTAPLTSKVAFYIFIQQI